MAKVWVLDTETKGTGARMVPLEQVLQDATAPARPAPAKPTPKPRRRRADARAERQPYRFKVIDVLSREVLADDADARTTLEALQGVRSLVDVSIKTREPRSGRWRPLSFDERQLLWGFRDRLSPD
jgi:hypothetical protein